MRVLIATDGSEYATAAARAVCHLPLAAGSTALVISAAPAFGHAPESRSADELRRWMHELATGAATQAASLVQDSFESVAVRVVAGDARRAILDAARDWNADLIVLGTRGLGALGSVLLGSVSVGVARHAHCPVLIVKADNRKVRRITVGIDGSDCAFAAAEFVALLPLDETAVVLLVAIVEPPPYIATAPDVLDGALGSSLAAVTEETRRDLVAALERAKGLFASGQAKVEAAVVNGRAAHELVRQCPNSDVDLLVVGARGKSAFDWLLLGSVSDAVIRHATCSVLVVRQA